MGHMCVRSIAECVLQVEYECVLQVEYGGRKGQMLQHLSQQGDRVPDTLCGRKNVVGSSGERRVSGAYVCAALPYVC